MLVSYVLAMNPTHYPQYPGNGGAAEMARNADQVRLASIFQYVYAGFHGLLALVLFAVFLLAGSAVQISDPNQGGPGPFSVAMLIGGIGLLVCTFLFALAVANFFAARFIAERRNHTYCIIVSALECLSFPFGTAVGVFTLIVLSRPEVKAWFDRGAGRPFAVAR